jgi:hypothetical protein
MLLVRKNIAQLLKIIGIIIQSNIDTRKVRLKYPSDQNTKAQRSSALHSEGSIGPLKTKYHPKELDPKTRIARRPYAW